MQHLYMEEKNHGCNLKTEKCTVHIINNNRS